MLSKEEKNQISSDDIIRLAAAEEPNISVDIQLLWCLSGRTDVSGRDVDKLQRPFDPNDDRNRLLRTIAIADEINAKLADKKVAELTDADRVIKIFYNGRTQHNLALQAVLEQLPSLLPYPKHLFIIKPISPDNTLGQVNSFEAFLRSEEGQQYQTIGVVTSKFHELRAACAIGNRSPRTIDENGRRNALSTRNYFFFGIDPLMQAPGTRSHDLVSEPNAIMNYSSWFNNKPPTCARGPSLNTFLTQQDVLNFVQRQAGNLLKTQIVAPRLWLTLWSQERTKKTDNTDNAALQTTITRFQNT